MESDDGVEVNTVNKKMLQGEFLKEGYMYKRGRLISSWKKRYFRVVKNRYLGYAVDENSEVAIGRIPLESIYRVKKARFSTCPENQDFGLVLYTKGRCLEVCCNSEEDREDWARFLYPPPLSKKYMKQFKECMEKKGVRERKKGFLAYKKCFVGSEATRIIMSIWGTSDREYAECIGARMMNEHNMFFHVTGEYDFHDRFLFYRFTDSGLGKDPKPHFIQDVFSQIGDITDSNLRGGAKATGLGKVVDLSDILYEEGDRLGTDVLNFGVDVVTTGANTGFDVVKNLGDMYETGIDQLSTFFAAKAEENQTLQESSLLGKNQEELVDIWQKPWKSKKIEERMKLLAHQSMEKRFDTPSSLSGLYFEKIQMVDQCNTLRKQIHDLTRKQIQDARKAVETMTKVKEQTRTIEELFSKIMNLGDVTCLVEEYALVRKTGITLRNLEITKEWVAKFKTMKEDYFDLQKVIKNEYKELGLKYKEEIAHDDNGGTSDLDLLDVHLQLRQLIEFQCKALFELKDDPVRLKQIEKYLSFVNKLQDQFITIMRANCKRILVLVSQGNFEKVIKFIRIIEREEIYNRQIEQNGDKNLLKLLKRTNYREIFFDSVKESVRLQFKNELGEKVSFNDRLEVIKDIFEDLKQIKRVTQHLFPPEYEIMKFYVQQYQQQLDRLISNRTNNLKSISNADTLSLLQFLPGYRSLFAGYEKYIDKFVDYGHLMKKLVENYVSICSNKIIEWIDQLIVIIFNPDTAFIQRGDAFYSPGPLDCFKLLIIQLELAQSNPDITKGLSEACRQSFGYYRSKFVKQLDEKIESLPLINICGFINDFKLFAEQIHQFEKKLILHVHNMDVDSVHSYFSSMKKLFEKDHVQYLTRLEDIASKMIIPNLKNLFTSQWKTNSDIVFVKDKLGSICDDLEHVLERDTYEDVITRIEMKVGFHYLELFLTVQVNKIDYEWVQALYNDACALQEVFGSESEIARLLFLLSECLGIVQFQDAAEIMRPLGKFFQEFPDAPREFVKALISSVSHFEKEVVQDLNMYVNPFFDEEIPNPRKTIWGKTHDQFLEKLKKLEEEKKQNTIGKKLTKDAGNLQNAAVKGVDDTIGLARNTADSIAKDTGKIVNELVKLNPLSDLTSSVVGEGLTQVGSTINMFDGVTKKGMNFLFGAKKADQVRKEAMKLQQEAAKQVENENPESSKEDNEAEDLGAFLGTDEFDNLQVPDNIEWDESDDDEDD